MTTLAFWTVIALVAFLVCWLIAAMRDGWQWHIRAMRHQHDHGVALEDLKYALGRESQLRLDLEAARVRYDLAMKKFAETFKGKDGVIAELDATIATVRKALNDTNTLLTDAQANVERQGSKIVEYETKLMTLQRTVDRYEAQGVRRR